jgi:tetratricopeptide (TPR) repeat protein
MLQMQKRPPASIREKNRAVTKRIESLVQQCLRVDPSERPRSISLVRQALEIESGRIAKAQRRIQAHPFRASAGALATLLICASLISFGLSQLPSFERSFQAGLTHRATGEHELAIEDFHDCVRLDPSSRPAKFEYAKSLLYFGRLDDAIEAFGSLANDRQDGRSMAYLAFCFNLAGNPSAAIFWYEQLPDEFRDELAILNNLGASYLAVPHRLTIDQRLSAPESLLSKAFELDRTSSGIQLNLLHLEVVRSNVQPDYCPIVGLPYARVAMQRYSEHSIIRRLVCRWFTATMSRGADDPLRLSESDVYELKGLEPTISFWLQEPDSGSKLAVRPSEFAHQIKEYVAGGFHYTEPQ